MIAQAPSVSQSSAPTLQSGGGDPLAHDTSRVAAPSAPPNDQSLFSRILEGNPYFSAGFGLMVFGAALAGARKGITAGALQAQRRLLVTLEIPSKDRAHSWFLQWMGAQAKAQAMRNAGLLPHRKESLREFMGLGGHQDNASDVANSNKDDPLQSAHGRASPIRIYSHDISVETSMDESKKMKHDPIIQGQPLPGSTGTNPSNLRDARFSFVPGPGTHFFRYKGCWMRLQRERNGRLVDLTTGAPWETVTLTTLRSHQSLFNELLSEARQLAQSSTEGKTTIFTVWGVEWRPFGLPRRARNLDSVVLSRDKRQKLEHDVKRFMQRGWWYADRGIPYRRGYLLHGSPGSGKSSFIYALAGELDMSICLLNLSDRGLTDDKLNFLLSNAPERSIILLEDVDSAFLGRKRSGEGDGFQGNVTFSGLLNSLDGVASSESRIVFMTTNHVERLDPALIRPGRIDYIEELGDAEPEQVTQLFKRFYGRRRRTPDENGVVQEEEDPPMSDGKLNDLAMHFASVVEQESIRRRRSLGLDDSGRVAREEPKISQEETRLQASRAMRLRSAARGGVSMAELQGLFIQYPDDGQAAVSAFQAYGE